MWIVGGPERKQVLGMELECWTIVAGDCTAQFGVGDDWATLYGIVAETESRGQAAALLRAAKQHYETAGKRFGSSVALNPRMSGIPRRLSITEYRDARPPADAITRALRDTRP